MYRFSLDASPSGSARLFGLSWYRASFTAVPEENRRGFILRETVVCMWDFLPENSPREYRLRQISPQSCMCKGHNISTRLYFLISTHEIRANRDKRVSTSSGGNKLRFSEGRLHVLSQSTPVQTGCSRNLGRSTYIE